MLAGQNGLHSLFGQFLGRAVSRDAFPQNQDRALAVDTQALRGPEGFQPGLGGPDELGPFFRQLPGAAPVDPGHVVPEVDQLDLTFLHTQTRQGLLEFFVQQAALTSGHDNPVEALLSYQFFDMGQARGQARPVVVAVVVAACSSAGWSPSAPTR